MCSIPSVRTTRTKRTDQAYQIASARSQPEGRAESQPRGWRLGASEAHLLRGRPCRRCPNGCHWSAQWAHVLFLSSVNRTYHLFFRSMWVSTQSRKFNCWRRSSAACVLLWIHSVHVSSSTVPPLVFTTLLGYCKIMRNILRCVLRICCSSFLVNVHVSVP